MPELPEVEAVRRGVAPALVGRRIVTVEAPQPHRHLIGLDDAAGLTCRQVRRRGKFIIADLSAEQSGTPSSPRTPDKELVIHLGMTGRLSVSSDDEAHLRARIVVDGGTVVAFCDPRRFGRLLVCDPGHYPTLPLLADIGPDPGDCAPEQFIAALGRTRRPVKACLLDQRLVAGIGNIYADEALHRAALAPHIPAAHIPADTARDLLGVVVDLLAAAVAAGGTTVRDYRHADGSSGGFQRQLQVYGRGGQPCRRCAATLARGTVAGRGTVWCPSCQPSPTAAPVEP
jgi:formamidopyrimidine-DNA glycosylase